MILQGATLYLQSIEEVQKQKEQYSAIRCIAKDVKIRTDRFPILSYIHNKDTFRRGKTLELTLIFKKDILTAISLNKKSIRGHDRKSAFLLALTEIFETPKAKLDLDFGDFTLD